jgi:hypothetical protein
MRVIALDFDGTCDLGHTFPDIGEPNRKVIEKAIQCQEKGDHIILWTCRTGIYLDHAIEWALEQGLKYDSVMEDPEWSSNESRKVNASIFVDDKAPGSIEYFVEKF